MNKTTTNLLLMLITILAGTWFYICYCSECGAIASNDSLEEVAMPKEPASTSFPFAFGNGDFSYQVNDNYNFRSSSATILTPVAAGVTSGIDQLKTFLSQSAGKTFNITGYYTDDETNSTAYPDLGLARANAVKNSLVSQGIPSMNININSKLMNDMVPKAGIFYGPLYYDIADRSETADEELTDLFENINSNPLILYFNTAEASINLDMEQRQKVADISRYIDKVADAAVNITGHTDNTGQADTNMKLGLDRANFAKQYLMENGISSEKIVTASKGQTEPIADNATEEGRTLNRRTVVTLTNNN